MTKTYLPIPVDFESRPIPEKLRTLGIPKNAEHIEASRLAFRVWECIIRGLIARTMKVSLRKDMMSETGEASVLRWIRHGI